MFASDDEDDTSADRHNKERSTTTATRTGSGCSRSSQKSRGKNVAFAEDVDGGDDNIVDHHHNAGSTADGGPSASFDLSTFATDGFKVCLFHNIMRIYSGIFSERG